MLVDKLNFYRADNKGNITRPEEFWKTGLWSKQINGGDPSVLQKYGWIKTIKAHIKPTGLLEKSLYNTTTFLSFTSCDKKVKEYLAGKEKRKSKVTKSIIEADGYIFKVSFNKKDLIKIDTGIYLYKYHCTPQRFKSLTNQFANPLLCALNFTSCEYCNKESNIFHGILLIDCVSYLNTMVEKTKELKDSLNNATVDKEWLVMSIDPFGSGSTSAQIPIGDFLSFELSKFE